MLDEATGDLDSKTAALLTHISILIAGLFVLYSSKTGEFRFVILIVLCLYLFLAISCLRIIRFSFTYVREFAEHDLSAYAEEFYNRGQLFNVTASVTIYVTIAMIMTLIIDAIL